MIRITAAHMPESGRVSMRLDGKPVGFSGEENAVDLRTDYRTLSRNISSQPVELTQGDHRLTLRCETSEPSDRKMRVGIDFIWVQKN